jgi:hypothetical protein
LANSARIVLTASLNDEIICVNKAVDPVTKKLLSVGCILLGVPSLPWNAGWQLFPNPIN